jgi:pantoate--beta-alanine ligase
LLTAGFGSVDYLDLRDADSLASLPAYQPSARLFIAARMGSTRLIDNIAV